MRTPTSTPFMRATVLVGALVASSACATKNDVRDMQFELRQELQAISARQDSLFSALLATQDATRSTQDATERELMDTRGSIVNELRSLSQQMQRIEELAGQNQIAIQNLGQRVDGAGSADPMTSRRPASSPMEDDGLLAPGFGGDPDQDYDDALELYRGGQLFGAQAAFEAFLGDHPQHPLVPVAHFYLGTIAEENEDYDAAIASFERVGELYPDAERVANASLKIGQIHVLRGDDDAARQVFRNLIATYEDSSDVLKQSVVEQARRELRELGG